MCTLFANNQECRLIFWKLLCNRKFDESCYIAGQISDERVIISKWVTIDREWCQLSYLKLNKNSDRSQKFKFPYKCLVFSSRRYFLSLTWSEISESAILIRSNDEGQCYQWFANSYLKSLTCKALAVSIKIRLVSRSVICFINYFYSSYHFSHQLFSFLRNKA